MRSRVTEYFPSLLLSVSFTFCQSYEFITSYKILLSFPTETRASILTSYYDPVLVHFRACSSKLSYHIIGAARRMFSEKNSYHKFDDFLHENELEPIELLWHAINLAALQTMTKV
jgi:hypothetical protein